LRKTKIIATIGPSCDTKDKVHSLLRAGSDSIRLNFSHGSLEEKESIIRWVREYDEETDKHTAIIGDLQGSAVRIGDIEKIEIIEGREYKFTLSEEDGIHIGYEEVFREIEVGDTVYVDDGRLQFKVTRIENGSFWGKALLNGILGSRKTFLIRNKDIDLPPITDKDIEDLRFAIDNDVDYIALSFVRNDRDIEMLRNLISVYGGEQWILAKIERPQAVENIEDIIDSSDGVIVARGDLGLYYGLEEIPLIQSRIVKRSIFKGKITIIATQILDSMKENPQPSRAEVMDIYNAVGEGVDAIMLTGETAVGKYPVETVKWASKVLSSADKHITPQYNSDTETLYDKFAKGVLMLADNIEGKIIGYSKGGNTAMRISRYRPKKTVYIAVNKKEVARKINLRYGIRPLLVDGGYPDAFNEATRKLIDMGLVKKNDIAIYMGGLREKATDMVRVEIIT
jgi:pyruvate kinase